MAFPEHDIPEFSTHDSRYTHFCITFWHISIIYPAAVKVSTKERRAYGNYSSRQTSRGNLASGHCKIIYFRESYIFACYHYFLQVFQAMISVLDPLPHVLFYAHKLLLPICPEHLKYTYVKCSRWLDIRERQFW